MKKQVAKWLTAMMPGRAWGVVFAMAALVEGRALAGFGVVGDVCCRVLFPAG